MWAYASSDSFAHSSLFNGLIIHLYCSISELIRDGINILISNKKNLHNLVLSNYVHGGIIEKVPKNS
jgi:hypothetical protein